MIGKVGDEKLLYLYWFVIIGIIFLSVVSATYLFFSADVDVRRHEALTLLRIVEDCLVDDQRYLPASISEGTSFDVDFSLAQYCGLNPSVFLRDELYVSVTFLDGAGQELITHSLGDASTFGTLCELALVTEADDVSIDVSDQAQCYVLQRDVQVINGPGSGEVLMRISSASNNAGKRGDING